MHYLVLISPPTSTSDTAATAEGGAGIRTEDTIPNPTQNNDNDNNNNNNTNNKLLSPSEAQFLYSHQYLLASHYRLSFLASFPPQLRRLDDNAGGTSMVQGPDTKEVVFVRVLVPEVTLRVPADETFPDEALGTTMRMGEVWVARWEGVKAAWERGDVEVL